MRIVVFVLSAIILAGCGLLKAAVPTPPPAELAAPVAATAVPAKPTQSVSESSLLSSLPALTQVGDEVDCPAGISRKKRNVWSRVGAHPHLGTRESALRAFSEIPSVVRDKLSQAIREKRFTVAAMQNGDRVCSMMYTNDKGVHVRWDNIEARWRDRTHLKVQLYEVEHDGLVYQFMLPPREDGGCDNDSWRAVKRVKQHSTVPTRSTVDPVRVQHQQPPAGATMKLRVRYWELSSFTQAMQARIFAVMEKERDATYPFADSAVSRDLGDEMVSEWQKGRATTVSRCLSATIYHPDAPLGLATTSCPGQHPAYPKLTYWEGMVSIDHANSSSAVFAVKLEPQAGCDVVYPRKAAYYLSSRPGELANQIAGGSRETNLNAIVKCK